MYVWTTYCQIDFSTLRSFTLLDHLPLVYHHPSTFTISPRTIPLERTPVSAYDYCRDTYGLSAPGVKLGLAGNRNSAGIQQKND